MKTLRSPRERRSSFSTFRLRDCRVSKLGEAGDAMGIRFRDRHVYEQSNKPRINTPTPVDASELHAAISRYLKTVRSYQSKPFVCGRASFTVAKSVTFYALINGTTVSFSSAKEKFDTLAELWEERAGAGITDYHDFAHLQIIGMGAQAIRFLLDGLKNGGPWVFALKAITGEQEETPDMYGDPARVIGAWLEWGKRNGYIRE